MYSVIWQWLFMEMVASGVGMVAIIRLEGGFISVSITVFSIKVGQTEMDAKGVTLLYSFNMVKGNISKAIHTICL